MECMDATVYLTETKHRQVGFAFAPSGIGQVFMFSFRFLLGQCTCIYIVQYSSKKLRAIYCGASSIPPVQCQGHPKTDTTGLQYYYYYRPSLLNSLLGIRLWGPPATYTLVIGNTRPGEGGGGALLYQCTSPSPGVTPHPSWGCIGL